MPHEQEHLRRLPNTERAQEAECRRKGETKDVNRLRMRKGRQIHLGEMRGRQIHLRERRGRQIRLGEMITDGTDYR
jgi:hypothetical protein